MSNHNLMPHAAQPVNRIPMGQLFPELAELSEEALSYGASVLPSSGAELGEEDYVAEHLLSTCHCWFCSYDGDEAE